MQNNNNRERERFFRIPIGQRCVLERGKSGAEVFLDESKSFSITIPESFILKKLLEEPGRVIEKNTLICEAWGSPEIIGQNSLPVAITNLRKILDLADIEIVNIPRVGYRLDILESKANLEVSDTTDTAYNERGNPNDNSVTLSPVKFWGALFLCGFSLYAFLYIGFSWVSVDCHKFGSAEVCFIEGDTFDPKEVEGESGYYYYSSKSGLTKVML